MKVTKKLHIFLTFDMKLRPCAVSSNRAAPGSNWATSFKFIPEAKHAENQQIWAEHYQCGMETKRTI